jgi:hypothetical protein
VSCRAVLCLVEGVRCCAGEVGTDEAGSRPKRLEGNRVDGGDADGSRENW